MKWQKNVRRGLAAFGIVCAIAVYAAIGERQPSAPPQSLPRLDPRSIIESTGAAFQQFSAAKQEYVIEADRQLTYEGGATKFIGVTIRVKERAGRDFVISGREAQAGEGQKDLQVNGDVRLAASDGFVATTEHATFSDADATVRAAGPVTFQKGRMSGSGVGMSYDQSADVLTLADAVRVSVTDESGKTTMEFTSASATLARAQDYLSLDGSVHALRGEQTLESDQGRALLSPDDELIRFIELRGNARVVGGGAFDSMSARDIDLDYSDDGDVLERVVLQGGGTVLLVGEDEEGGRQFEGDSLELMFAPDQTLTQATGRGGVRMVLPAVASTPSRTITARSFDASGEPGKGLTAARFDGDVEFEEKGAARRRAARAGALRTTLSGQDVTGAVFTTAVLFETEGLRASAGEVQYDPSDGSLRLRGAEGGKLPRVSDDKIEIDADSIDVTIEGPRMVASGHVRTVLRPSAAGARSAGEGTTAGGRATRLPGLLQQGQAANVSAATLDYQGVAGTAAYTGEAMLWQGDTTIRADALSLDQRNADLVAVGNGRANLPLEGGISIGRASEIRYDDAARRITFVGLQPVPGAGPTAPAVSNPAVSKPGAATAVARATPAQLSGPQGDLRAERIEVILAGADSKIDRLEAYRDVNVRLDTRTASGDRLTYFDADGRYVITGVATVPVTIIEECRETTGRTVTFFKSSERIIVDGNEEVRTQSRRGGPCPASTTP